jgi:hypothetical protein
MATLIEMIGFVASTVSIKSSLSATSAVDGGGVPGWVRTGGYYPYGPYEYSEYSYLSYYPGYGYGYGNYGHGYAYAYPSVSYYGSYYSGINYENDDQSAVRRLL